MASINIPVPRKSKLMAIPYISRHQLIVLLLCFSFICACYAFPPNNYKSSKTNSIDIRLRQNDILNPKKSNNILKWTVEKLKEGRQSLQILWNNIIHNSNQPNRRNSQLLVSERKPEYNQSTPYWRSLMSKAWSYVTGFFQRSEKYLARRRMDTGRQDGIAGLMAATPAWVMPLAMIGMTALFREPLDMITKGVLGNFNFCVFLHKYGPQFA